MQQQQGEKKPTLVTTFATLLIYLKDLLSDVKRNINSNNPHFLARIGFDQTSQALLECIGYILNEEQYFIPPAVETIAEKDRLQQIQQELMLSLNSLRQELGVTTVPKSKGEEGLQFNDNVIYEELGVVASLEHEKAMNQSDDYINDAYAYFGLTSGASDSLVTWAYEKLLNETTILVDDYEAMDNLVKIANHRSHSDALQALVACERSKGRIGHNDVGDAYAYFGITADTAEDVELIKGLYRIKMGDEPAEKNTHQEKLKIIAIARNSFDLLQFLKREKGITASSDGPAIESLTGVPSSMINQQVKTPVGLNNIGNTCYFNSLLQYYNAIIPFRETIINNEEHIESENSELKRIGNIVVDQLEIRRAKKFVGLLRELFLNLQHTNEKAISPQYDLAYMALLNEKEEEEQKQQLQQPEQLQQSTPIMDERLPDELPPSYEESEANRSVSVSELTATTKEVKKVKPSVDSMLFGRQQDVTECMSNVMYLVEAALKPLSKTDEGEQIDDMVRQLFYGKARQILTYHDEVANKTVTKEMEEDFSHVIVDASEQKNLYDGLDEYFFADKVENYQGGRDALREVTVKLFPPIFQILVQRVQFDRATANVYKSNEFIQFDKVIYLDRYADKNFELLKDKRLQVSQWRAELEKNKKLVNKYTKFKNSKLSVPELLETTHQILKDLSVGDNSRSKEELEKALNILEREKNYTRQKMVESTKKIKDLEEKIKHQYDDCQGMAYKLHAVFIHQGQASYGHYWIYILDHKEDQWWRYNDSQVTKVQEQEVVRDTTGSTANAYFLVYIEADKVNELVETVIPK
ncbi:hypothetical protein BDF20DRAFT_817902 [Mycotypha africana]|uniref:uncharacterized protein n=1 Tax=Mycotypha africana TaxID=64632 RepID=UPI0023009E7F|nr:uncharacterized protein BDF20DRAFT_817902 [Mycotypha africana]KAI8982326.1 hypothetical protein BDF20DRAFT_817902 [Mycotypha africana]